MKTNHPNKQVNHPTTVSSAAEMQPASKASTLTALLWEQVTHRPDAVAVDGGQGQLSYRQLWQRSMALADVLRQHGLAGDECVGVFCDPSSELLAAVWATLAAGSAYLPLAPEYPEDRIRYMMESARLRVVLTQRHLRARLADLAPAGTVIIDIEDVADAGEDAPLEYRSDARTDGLAYVIYTSGSTGKPKGVMIEHRSIVNQMNWLKAAQGIDESKSVLLKTPMSFDAAQWEILAACCGSRVVVGPVGVYRDVKGLIDTIMRHQVTTLQCVPTLLQALVDDAGFFDCRSLTQIFSGGEALSQRLAFECLQARPGCTLVNLYGPTECTINASAHTVDPEAAAARSGTVPIGRPVANTTYYILDQDLRPVASGETGELYIGGAQLARGYLHRPDLTAERFIVAPSATDASQPVLYRTGDLARWNADGSVQYVGRVDNQVKLRGFRVELDEIRVAIERHEWVKNAAVLVKSNPRTGQQSLIACVELNPKEAALMDQGNHGAHHQSKSSRLQVRAQLSNPGLREEAGLRERPALDLPGKTPTAEQRRRVFARKTYRFYEGQPVCRADILRLFERRAPRGIARPVGDLSFAELGEMLRYFGQYLSPERLLPKYGYASPGALYATQLYLETRGIEQVPDGFHYYHPLHHQLIQISPARTGGTPSIRLHFVGKRSAIEPVYKNNILEVLEMETGHMLGLFDEILPAYGLRIGGGTCQPAWKAPLDCADDDFYLGAFDIVADYGNRDEAPFDIYVQAHPGKVAGLPAGQYRLVAGELQPVSAELVRRKDVIAINQQVYDRASIGITMVSRAEDPWMQYISLGRKLQYLQMNDVSMGFMSSGYSSKSGNDLNSARRIASILGTIGEEAGPSYFCVGGPVSAEQQQSEGMREDIVHMNGPAELIKQDLANFLPEYMLPNRIVVLDALPTTANGKVDRKALESMGELNLNLNARPTVLPRTATEQRVAELWMRQMKWDAASVDDDFFESGGNSLSAVALIHDINKHFGIRLPFQAIFTAPTIEKLAQLIDGEGNVAVSRLVRLQGKDTQRPVFCWPGLGGYPMNLKVLADSLALDRPFYGVQAVGINEGEAILPNIAEMAAEDIKAIKQRWPSGPYSVWGYSFGARVAFEVAAQLERAGDRVDRVVLIAPGSPIVEAGPAGTDAIDPAYADHAFVTILFSVFGGGISGPVLKECLKVAKDDESFVSFISSRYPHLDKALVRRITSIVHQTYEFKYTFRELMERQLNAPIVIFKAKGDDYSFVENHGNRFKRPPTVVSLDVDHYGLLKEPGVATLVNAIDRLQLASEQAAEAPVHLLMTN